MAFCLPEEIKQKFEDALVSGKLNPADLSVASSAERRVAFADVVGTEYAKELNAGFESKLLLKNQEAGFIRWANSVRGLTPRAKSDLVTRISKLDKVLTSGEHGQFLADLAEKKLGTEVTPEEAQHITDLSKIAQEARNTPTDNLSGVSNEYLKAADELRKYIASLKPLSATGSIGKNLATIARNNLLMNPSTPLKTLIGQTMNSAVDIFTRRLATFSSKGQSYDLVRKANSEAYSTFLKTGVNVASMESLDDVGKLGEGKHFDQPSGMESSNPIVKAAEVGVRKTAQLSNFIAIDLEHNYSFVKFYQKAFYDMANIISSNFAKGDKSQADAIFIDASKVKPTTEAGAAVRAEAQRNAARATSTNNTLIARMSGEMQTFLNKNVGDGVGDALMPIVKIPSNLIWNGIENAGVGFFTGAKDLLEGKRLMQSGDLAVKYQGAGQYARGIQTMIRTAGALTVAAYMTSQLKPSDFKTDRYGASYVRIGGIWINTEYMYWISPALAGMMDIKKGKGKQDAFTMGTEYLSGAGQGLRNVPAVSSLNDIVTSVLNTNETTAKKSVANFFLSRAEPSFVHQISNGNSPVKNLFLSSTGLPTDTELKKLGAK